ncbi:uncharacterized protein V1510DRAFT_404071 [Dipodascopsis tothii]|uniref:uncharacterized protein n=1 Tax=Dipodascopsis tothii TaxID=44089 RepID=UPI0034CDB231
MATTPGDFDEDALRRDLKMYMAELRSKQERLVDGLLVAARTKAAQMSEQLAAQAAGHGRHSIMQFTPTAAPGATSLRFTIDTYAKEGSAPTREHVSHLAVALPLTETLPLYKDYTPLSLDVQVDDDEYLRYLPYFGENEEEAGLNLEEAFEDRTGSLQELLQLAKTRYMARSFGELIGRCEISRLQLASYFFHSGTGESLSRLLGVSGADKDDVDEKRLELLERHTERLKARAAARVEQFCRAYGEVTGVNVVDILGLMPNGALVGAERAERAADEATPYSIDSYASLLCAFCCMHECPWHSAGYSSVGPDGETRAADVHEFKNHNKSTAAQNMFPDDEACSRECFLLRKKPAGRPAAWTDEERAMVRMTAGVMRANARTACLLATILARPCAEIHQRLAEDGGVPGRRAAAVAPASTAVYPAPAAARKRKTPLQYPDDCALSGDHLKRGNVSPCMHDGPCGDTCPCVLSQVTCEKACGCGSGCRRQWRGCQCTAGRCRTPACPCFKWNRECDPDLCRLCGADDILDPKNRDILEDKRLCRNVNLQRGIGKRTILGRSIVSGWGLFVGEPMRPDEYLGEYKGELISQDEAERRGKIYDKRGVSFLFESTKDQCVDSMKAGNKLRFINHSRQNPNCHARILLVNGIHRIAFFSRRHIKPGEELFIDYGYNNKTMKFVPLDLPGARKKQRQKVYKAEDRSASEESHATHETRDSDSATPTPVPPERRRRKSLGMSKLRSY